VVKFRDDFVGSLGTIFYNILTGDSFGIYYFIFVLVYLYVWGIFVNKFKSIGGVLLVVLIVTLPFLVFSTFPENNIYFFSRELFYRFPLNWLFFFTFGMWVKSMEQDKMFYTNMQKNKYLILASFLLSILLIIFSNNIGLWVIYTSLPWFIYSLLGIMTMFLFLQFTPLKIVKYLSDASYSIFLIHIFPLASLYYFFQISDELIIKFALLINILMFFISILVAILTRETVKRIWPSASSYIVGS
jgi:peptidoglycan/LPS O-acetylase OafA/YrhL